MIIECIVKFPDNIVNIDYILKEVLIDCTKDPSQFLYIPSKEKRLSLDKPPMPEEMDKLIDMGDSNRLVRFKIKLNQEEKEGWLVGYQKIEAFLSWLSFLCLRPFTIRYWSGGITKTSNSTTYSYKPDLPLGPEPIVKADSFLTPRNLGLEPLLHLEMAEEIGLILRWSRKGMMTSHDEEKIIFWMTAMELLSGELKKNIPKFLTCPKCKTQISYPGVEKTGLIDFIDQIGYSKKFIYDKLARIRGKIIHQKYDLSFGQLQIAAKAACALSSSLISYWLAIRTNVPFGAREDIKKDGYKFQHPVFGERSCPKRCLDNLSRLNI